MSTYPISNDLADSLDREIAWLTTVDTLPSLLVTNGGMFDLVQAYIRRGTPSKRSLYLVTATATVDPINSQREQNTYQFIAHIRWPISSPTGQIEDDQRDLAAAVRDTVKRIRGPLGDKTHGGRFLTAGEAGHPAVRVEFDPVDTAIKAGDAMSARIFYTAVDPDHTG